MPTPANGALDVILIDRLNTKVSDQAYILQQLRAYAEHAAPDVRTAVFVLTDRLVLVKGFTQNISVLQAALKAASLPRTAPVGDGGIGQASENLSANTGFLDQAGMTTAAAALSSADATYQSFQDLLRSQITLEAFNALGRSLVTVPGRKNLIWFSGSFPPGIFPGDTATAGYAVLDQEYRDTINLLSRSRIAVYPVDAKGVSNTSQFSAATATRGTVESTLSRQGLASAVGMGNETAAIAGSHIAMESIAYDTGGSAFYNSNDLTKATRAAVAGGSDFYTLAYSPDDLSPKHDYRNISVKVGEDGTKLSYRRGYFFNTSSDEKKKEAKAEPAGATPGPPSALKQALFLGGPEPTEVLMRVHTMPASAEPETVVAAGNQVNPKAKNMAGPFKRYQINMAVSARNMSFSHGPDNIYHTSVDFVTNVYDRDGQLVNVQSNTLNTNYDAKRFLEVMRGGIMFDQQVSVPVTGDYSLRIAVLDHTSGHVGAVEVPVAAVAGLAPAPATPGASEPAAAK